jgi:ferric-dicitrate binding protein FerR (iron transport regulator)
MHRAPIVRRAIDFRRAAISLGFVLLSVVGAPAQQPVGSVRSVQGDAFAESGVARRALIQEAAILLGDRVGTGLRSQLTMLLGRNTTLRLGERGSIVIDRLLVDAGGEIMLQSGPLMFDHPSSNGPENLQIRSPYGLIAVRGTRFFAGPDGRALGVFVEQGEVAVTAAGKTVLLREGQGTTIARPGASPSQVSRWAAQRIDRLFGAIRQVSP